MIAIWKFPIKVVSSQIVPMPMGTKILTVQVQRDKPCLWAIVDTGVKQGPRLILTVATGEDMGSGANWSYVGTYQLFDGEEVYHVFA